MRGRPGPRCRKSSARSRNNAPAETSSQWWAFANRSPTVVFPLPGGPLIATIIEFLFHGAVRGLLLGGRELRNLPEVLEALPEREVLQHPLHDLAEGDRQERVQEDPAGEQVRS